MENCSALRLLSQFFFKHRAWESFGFLAHDSVFSLKNTVYSQTTGVRCMTEFSDSSVFADHTARTVKLLQSQTKDFLNGTPLFFVLSPLEIVSP